MFNFAKVYLESKKNTNDWPIIIYDESAHESAQYTLFQAARAHDAKIAKDKWNEFVKQTKLECLSNEQVKVLLNTLDKRKQWAPLHYAVEANNFYVFSQLTTGKKRFQCDININGGNGENVLHIAARAENIWPSKDGKNSNIAPESSTMPTTHRIELLVPKSDLPTIVHHMLNLGADVNDRDDEGRTPLHMAVLENRYSFATELIVRGADIMATSKLRASVLYFALLPRPIEGDELMKMIELILNSVRELEERQYLVGLATMDNQTPLARAVCHPAVTTSLIQRLLKENDKIDDKQLLVAFDMAARHVGRKDQSYDYLIPLLYILKGRRCQEILRQLPLIFCRHNNVALLKWFYEIDTEKTSCRNYKRSVNGKNLNPSGYTPLLTAVFFKSKECIEFLLMPEQPLEARENLRAVNADSENILHICARRQVEKDLFDNIWYNLLDAYDNKNYLINMADAMGNKPLQVAAQFNHKHMCESLLDYIKKRPLKDEVYCGLRGEAAREACQAGHVEILELILSSDFNKQQQHPSNEGRRILQMRDENAYTCLHLAAAQGHKSIVEYLIAREIEVDAIGDRRQTPLHLACENGHSEIVELLLKAGASTTLRNAQVYNCLEIAIVNHQKNVVQELLTHSTWKLMMRNAQPIEHTEAFDTPMRKLIRYMPDIAVWLIDNKFTQTVGGPGQKMYKTIYDYEFYEDMFTAKDWYTQGTELVSEPKTCSNLWYTRGVELIHTCWCCCHSNYVGCCGCCTIKQNVKEEWYTNDAYTLVRNHPLFVVSQQKDYPELIEHFYHKHLRQAKLRSFGLIFFIASFFFYMAYLSLFTAAVLLGKHPKFFYDKAGVNMSVDLSTCEYVSNFISNSNNSNVTNEGLKTEAYKRIKWTLYALLSIFIAKNVITIIALFPKVLRIGGSYIEISALVLSYVYILDWYGWQSNVIFRCPVQYQLGAMGLLLAYINFLVYLRTSPVFDIGIYVVMLQVICVKFLRFLPVLLSIICGFGFTYWMLLQYEEIYGTPIEALMRTALMLFDLGYDDRLYDSEKGNVAHYKLVYLIFMLTAATCSIFVINLLIGLAVGEIPTLLTQGTVWRTRILYSLLSDYEILRIRFILVLDCITCNKFRHSRSFWFRPRPYYILEKDELKSQMGGIGRLWRYAEKHFFNEQIQDNIKTSTKSIGKKD